MSLNFKTTNDTLGEAGEGWTEVLVGPVSAALMETRRGEVEYIKDASSTAPSTDLFGHILKGEESQHVEDLSAGESVFARSIFAGSILVITT